MAHDHRADQHAAEDLAARAGRHAGQRPHGAGHRQGGATSSASIEVEIRKINAPAGKAPFGPPRGERPAALRDERVRQGSARQGRGALQLGGEEGAQRQAASARRCAAPASRSAPYTAGSIGFDGLLIIKPDGKVQIQSGIGNLGTHSVFDVHRVAAEMLGVPWEQCEVVWGDTAKHLPWTLHLGRQPDGARDDARGARRRQPTPRRSCRRSPRRRSAAARPATRSPNGRVSGGGRSMTFAQAGAEGDRARRQVRRPRSARRTSTRSRRRRSTGLAGQGLIVVGARQRIRATARRSPYVAGFAEVEVDVETGAYHDPGLHGGRRRRHRAQPAQPAGPDLRRRDARHRPRDRPEVGLRPALRRAAGQAVPLQQAADDSRRAAEFYSSPRSTSPIRKRRSARAASASRRSAPAWARS